MWAHNSEGGDARAREVASYGELNAGPSVPERQPADCQLIGVTTFSCTVTAADDWDVPAGRKGLASPCRAATSASSTKSTSGSRSRIDRIPLRLTSRQRVELCATVSGVGFSKSGAGAYRRRTTDAVD
jgi:erythromycin esterase-like protein